MRQSTLLVLNTLVGYARGLLSVFLGLVATRLLIGLLGVSDYGLLTALGAASVAFVFLPRALTQSALRQLAFDVGRDDPTRLEDTFNATLRVFAGLGGLSWLAGIALLPVVVPLLTVPEGRDTAVVWVYHLSLAQLVLNIALTPFRALYQAHQRLASMAVVDLVGRAADLVAVLLLVSVRGDRLVAYAGMTLGVSLLMGLAPAVLAWRQFPACRPRLGGVSREAARRLGGFAVWSMLTQLVVVLRDQGTVLMLNAFYGPLVNAAAAIALRAAGYQVQIAALLSASVAPAITASQARGDESRVRDLVLLGCKYPTLASLFLGVPLLLETEALLGLWLGSYPEESALFTRLMAASALAGFSSWGFSLAMHARGELRALTLLLSVPYLVAFGVAWLVLRQTAAPVWTLPATMFLTAALTSLTVKPWYVGSVVGIAWTSWLRRVVGPVGLVLLVAGGAAWGVRAALPEGLPRLAAVAACYAALAAPIIWRLALEDWERQHFLRIARAGLGRLNR